MEFSSHECVRFRTWLKENTSFSSRVVSDTVSRLRRLGEFVDPTAAGSEAELGYLLQQQAEFQRLQPSVKSQLKRAGMLYRQFIDTQPNM